MRLKDVDIIIDYYILHICYVMLCVYSIYIYIGFQQWGVPLAIIHLIFGFSIINRPFLGIPIPGPPHIYIYIHRCTVYSSRQKIHVYIYLYAHMYRRHNACVCIYIYIMNTCIYIYIHPYGSRYFLSRDWLSSMISPPQIIAGRI